MATYRFRVEYRYRPTGGPGYSVFHFRTATLGGDDEDAQLQVARDAISGFYEDLVGLFPTTMSVRGDTSWVNVENQEERGLTTQFVRIGTAPDLYLPTSSMLCLTHVTSTRTRSGRGRTFVGPLAAGTSQGDGTPTIQAANTLVQSAIDNLLTPFAGNANGSFVVWSPTQQVARDVTAFRTRDVFAVLRSRRD